MGKRRSETEQGNQDRRCCAVEGWWATVANRRRNAGRVGGSRPTYGVCGPARVSGSDFVAVGTTELLGNVLSIHPTLTSGDAPIVVKSGPGPRYGFGATSGIGWRAGGCGCGRVRVLRYEQGGFRGLGRPGSRSRRLLAAGAQAGAVRCWWRVGEQPVDLAGDVPFQAADDLPLVLALGSAPGYVLLGNYMSECSMGRKELIRRPRQWSDTG